VINRSRKILLTLLIAVLSVFVVYQAYLVFFDTPVITKGNGTHGGQDTLSRSIPPSSVQVDVLNGTGVSGVAQKMTSYVRSLGYDVVEMRNYKTPDVKETLVIDRSGNMEVARRIAADLGVSEKNVLQQLNPDYFVSTSIVIGKDFKGLPAWTQNKK
jgi:LytR cell envelope-related transcriptional attenuator